MMYPKIVRNKSGRSVVTQIKHNGKIITLFDEIKYLSNTADIIGFSFPHWDYKNEPMLLIKYTSGKTFFGNTQLLQIHEVEEWL